MFNKVQELAEAGDMSKEVAEALDLEISGELKKLRDENSGLRVKNKELTSSFEEVMGAKTSLEDQLSSYDEKIKMAKDEGKGEVVKQLEAERKKHDELVNNLKGFEKENTKLRIQNAVNSELGKFDVKKDLRGDAEVVLQSMVSLSDNSMVFGDGLSIEDGVKQYFESRQSYLNPVGDGTGSGARDGQSGGSSKVKSRDDLNKLNPSQKAEFFKSGGKIA